MSTKAAEDLGGVIVRTVEFVSDPPQEGEGAHRLIHLANHHLRLCNQPLGEPQGLRAPITALNLTTFEIF